MASESSRFNGQSLEDLYPSQTAIVPAAMHIEQLARRSLPR